MREVPGEGEGEGDRAECECECEMLVCATMGRKIGTGGCGWRARGGKGGGGYK